MGIQGIRRGGRAQAGSAFGSGQVDGPGEEVEDTNVPQGGMPDMAGLDQYMKDGMKQMFGGGQSGPGGGAQGVGGAGGCHGGGGGGFGGGGGGMGFGGGAHAPGQSPTPGASKPASAGGASGGGSGSGGGTTSNALLNEINRVRQNAGLSALTEKSSLDAAASSNDAANVATNDLEHHNGLIDGSMGEITAENSAGESAAFAVQQWLNSPEHRAIMMNPDYTEFGGSINGDFSTADFS